MVLDSSDWRDTFLVFDIANATPEEENKQSNRKTAVQHGSNTC